MSSKRLLFAAHHLGELRQEERGNEPFYVLPAEPHRVAYVIRAASVHWLVYPDEPRSAEPQGDPLAVLDGTEAAEDRWELEWKAPPVQPVRLVLCAVPEGDVSAGKEVIRLDGRPCAVLDEARVRALGPVESPYITEEEAMAVALKVQPDAPYVARLEEAFTGYGLEQPRPAWVLEALYPWGNRTAIVVDAVTGEPVTYAIIEPPHFPGDPVPLSRDEAVAAALERLGDSSLRVVDAEYTEEYPWRGGKYFAWVVRLAPGADPGQEISVAVHALTGDILQP